MPPRDTKFSRRRSIFWRAIVFLVFCFSIIFLPAIKLRRSSSFCEPARRALRIVVLTKSRLSAVRRLLHEIQQTDFCGSEVYLDIHVDGYVETSLGLEVRRYAENFVFQHGSKTVLAKEHSVGLAGAWFGSCRSLPADEMCVIFEDDVALSPFWYSWLMNAWEVYAQRDDIAGLSLQRQTLVPLKPHSVEQHVGNSDSTFLYPLVGSIGFSPHPTVWKNFLSWIEYLDNNFDVSVPDLITSDWWNELDKRQMWTQHFIYYCLKHDLYTLYTNLPRDETVAAHLRLKGEHFMNDQGRDFKIAQTIQMDFPMYPRKFDWDGQLKVSIQVRDRLLQGVMLHAAKLIQKQNGFVYLLFSNSGFLDVTKNWICSMQRFPEVLSNVLFVVSSPEVALQLERLDASLKAVVRHTEHQGKSQFGSPAYFQIVVDRIKIQNFLLQHNISTFVIESDQHWTEDITPYLRQPFLNGNLIGSRESSSNNDEKEVICGGFFGLPGTAKMKIFFSSFLESYQVSLAETTQEGDFKQFENDQVFLTKVAKDNNVEIVWLHHCVYANGLWYKKKLETSNCNLPGVIHNNYIIGIAQKVDRAKENGQWYLDSAEKCRREAI